MLNWHKLVDKIWYQWRFLAIFLLPFSCIFYLLSISRRYYYRLITTSNGIDVPVIVIGNITVGGTGKTPLVICLTQYLQKKGYKVGIISRGYGGKAKEYPLLVTEESSVATIGDEAKLLVTATKAPMVIAPNRSEALVSLMTQFECDIVISDDGLQHYALRRDIEIAVVDANYQFGNGYLLPSGPLREPISRLSTVDIIVSHGEYKGLTDCCYHLTTKSCVQLLTQTHQDLDKVVLLTAIAKPERFIKTVQSLGIEVVDTVIFPDHYLIQKSDLPDTSLPILMTAKDAVKCLQFNDERLWYLPVEAELNQAFYDQFDKMLGAILQSYKTRNFSQSYG